MTAPDDIAKVLAFSGDGLKGHTWDSLSDASRAVWRAKADALLASPALARLLDEARAEGWDAGRSEGHSAAQDYYNFGGGCGPDSWDCTCPNPYRKDTP